MKIRLYMCGGEKPVSQYPLGLGYLKANITGHQVEIVSNPAELMVAYDGRNPHMVGLSSGAWGLREAIEIAHSLPDGVMTILGGQGTLWEDVYKKHSAFDWVVQGPGEAALQDILDNKIMPSVVRRQICMSDLKYPERGKCGEQVPILSARGCPFKCRFCSSKTFWGGVHLYPPEYFIAEVKHLIGMYPHSRSLYVLDDLFTASHSRLDEIHRLWMASGLHKRWKLSGFVRASTFTEKVGRLMKEMGFESIRFGAESGSDRVLELLGKRSTVAENQRAIDIGNKIGMPVYASFMTDIPGETEEDKQATLRFIARNRGKMEVRGFYKFRAFPGTEMYDGKSPLETDMRVR